MDYFISFSLGFVLGLIVANRNNIFLGDKQEINQTFKS